MDTLLRRVRRRLDITQEELAEMSGVSLSTIKEIERGARRECNIGTMVKLAKAMDVSLVELIPRED